MSKFKAFMAQNKKTHENLKFKLSADFVDEDGNLLEWEIKHLSAGENERIQNECLDKVPVAGKPGQFTRELNMGKYNTKLICHALVTPDLNDKDLQDSYGVMGAEQLILTMLSAADYNRLSAKILEFNGFKDINEDVEEAKNS